MNLGDFFKFPNQHEVQLQPTDANWNVKISDLGLSKFGPANQQYTFLVSNAVGTFGYWDPREREDRPSMSKIVKSLKSALKHQTDQAEDLSVNSTEESLQEVLSLPESHEFKQEIELSLIGIQNAGKTSFANVVTNRGYSDKFTYTVGFNVVKVTKRNVNIKLWDLGGVPRYRSIWERHCRKVSAIVYVVDAANHNVLFISKAELDDLLRKPSLSDIPLLVLGNKTDNDGALTKEAFTEQMNLSSITDREVCCFMISCKNLENIDSAVDWLVRHPKLES
ncbi:hypothetical protein OSB04_030067 [Centaurea solstitialis]|uniref:Uncharacterized protein n=1 Tax=Centaurea solstitialis TaxID=347529 RepID=A0AA38W4K9_9ASTR|nr:hypothetical protein OSB04_030067 [Centaurea solstitialis]